MKIIANFLNKFLDEHAKNEIDKRQELLVFCNNQINSLKEQIKHKNIEIHRLKYLLDIDKVI